MKTTYTADNPVVRVSITTIEDGAQHSLYHYDDIDNVVRKQFMPNLDELRDASSNDEMCTLIARFDFSIANDEEIERYEQQTGQAVIPLADRIAQEEQNNDQ